MNKTISVIIPAWNAEDYLEHCLDSVIHQTYEDLDIIVVDDGSTDSTGRIAEQFARTDSRIRVVHQENRGLGAARNAGLDLARGELLAFVDSDDWLETNAYETMAGLMEKYDCDIVTCGRNIVENGSILRREFCLQEGELITSEQEALHCFLIRDKMDMAAWDKLYRFSLFDGIRFPESFYASEDHIPLFSVLCRINTIYLSGLPLYNYNKHPGSITWAPITWKSLGMGVYAPVVAKEVREKYPELSEEADAYETGALLSVNDMAILSRDFKEQKQFGVNRLKQMKLYRNPYLRPRDKWYVFFVRYHMDTAYVRLRFGIRGNSHIMKLVRLIRK